MQGVSWRAEELAAFEEGLCSVLLVKQSLYLRTVYDRSFNPPNQAPPPPPPPPPFLMRQIKWMCRVADTRHTHFTSYSHLLASLSPTNHRFVADILAVNDLLGNEPWSDSPRQHGTLGRSSWCCTLFARTGASSEKQFSFLSWHINLFQRSLHFLLLVKHLPAAVRQTDRHRKRCNRQLHTLHGTACTYAKTPWAQSSFKN